MSINQLENNDETVVNKLFNEKETVEEKKTGPENFKILIVDDQLINRQILLRGLGDMGYKVSEAENGIKAILKARKEKPHLILMDIDMPEMNGLEATRRIRKDEELKNVKIIMVTANDRVSVLKEALATKIDDYVVKPVIIRDIDKRLKQQLNISTDLDKV